MKQGFNVLESRARQLFSSGRPGDAIKIYFFMADGDPFLDGGYLSKKIAECSESMGDFHAAKYWYGRAVEENPEARMDCANARQRVAKVAKIDDLLLP